MLPTIAPAATAGLHALTQPSLHRLMEQVRPFEVPAPPAEGLQPDAAPLEGNDLLEHVLQQLR